MKHYIAALLAFFTFFTAPCVAARKKTVATPAVAVKPNKEIARLYAEDQSDRQPTDDKPIDGNVVGPRDEVRKMRALELYKAGEL